MQYMSDDRTVDELCCQKQAQALRHIQMLLFALQETSLYLNSHPNDLRVLERHNYYSDLYKKARSEYIKDFNMPLSNLDASEGYWNYVKQPWPWRENCCCKTEVDD